MNRMRWIKLLLKIASITLMLAALAFFPLRRAIGWQGASPQATQAGPTNPELEKLAESLINARTEDERAALLQANRSRFTKDLRRILQNKYMAPNYQRKDYPGALIAARLIIAISGTIDDKPALATAYNFAGLSHLQQDQYQQAIAHLEPALAGFKEQNRVEDVATTLNTLGAVLQKQGNFLKALDYFQEGLRIREQQKNRPLLADSYSNLGLAHYALGNYEQAMECYRQSLSLRAAGEDATAIRIGQGQTYHNLGMVFERRGNYAKAMEYFEKSLQLKTEAGEERETTTTLNEIGRIYEHHGNLNAAAVYYQRSLAVSRQHQRKVTEIEALNHLGQVLELQGRLPEALQNYQTGLKLSQEIGQQALTSQSLRHLGSAHRLLKATDRALSSYQQSLKISEAGAHKDEIAETLTHIAALYYSASNYEEAIKQAERTASLAGEIGAPDFVWQAQTIIGQAHRKLGQNAAAIAAYQTAISTIETLRAETIADTTQRQGFFENKLAPYLGMIELLSANNDFPAALGYLERARARALVEVLQSGKANLAKALTVSEREQERQLNNELASLNSQFYNEQKRQPPDPKRLSDLARQLESARLTSEDFRTQLYAAHPELKVQRGEAKTLTLGEAALLMPDEKTAFLNYLVTPERVQLFMLTKTKDGEAKLRVYPLAIKREELAAKVELFRGQLAGRKSQYATLARELYGHVLKAAKADLPAQAKLLIVPDGPLWELPFQALLDERNRYLWQDHVIAYAPSLTVLREMEKVKRGGNAAKVPPSLFAIGDPALGGESLARAQSLMGGEFGQLPEARAQVEALRKFYDASRSKVFTGAAAAEATVKAEAGKYDILHFATHGILNDRNPLYSQILLAQTDQPATGNDAAKEDGLLEAWEIMQMDLRADLAVLSACETARGRVSSGEGMIGLTWALFVAGVPTTVVSQWKVRADSTADLMVEFHRQLQLTNTQKSPPPASNWKKAEALRQAALKLLSGGKFQHPFYWAGFVLVGKTG